MPIDIRLATAEADREAVYRFRYAIFVEEMGRRPPEADHERGRLTDVLDRTAHILAAWDGDELVGTLRTNFVRQGDVGYFRKLCGLDDLPAEMLKHVSVTTRAAVVPAMRCGTLFFRLARAVYRFGLQRDIRHDFILSRPDLMEGYHKLGYRPCGPVVMHPEAGLVNPLRLDILDLPFESAPTPFVPTLWDYLMMTPNQYLNANGGHSMDMATPSSTTAPASSREEFTSLINDLVYQFPCNRLCQKLDENSLTQADYHALLNMIFHQTYEGPATFALAASHCDPRRYLLRDYLIEHAEEEKSHWQWIIEDLRSTGFDGPDPRSRFPQPACQQYVAFNVYTAVRMPAARLGMAAFLESVGATFGKRYATKLCTALKLRPDQAKFFYGHGDTDVGHTADILRVLGESDLTPYEWAWLGHAAQIAAGLYGAMYDAAVA